VLKTRREALPKHAFQRLERQCTLAAIRYLGKKAVLPFSLNGNGLFSDQAQDTLQYALWESYSGRGNARSGITVSVSSGKPTEELLLKKLCTFCTNVPQDF
jgi:hypothetical protein